MNPTESLPVKLFLHHVPRFRTAGVLPLMEGLLREGFEDIFLQFDQLNSTAQKNLLQELKTSDQELVPYSFTVTPKSKTDRTRTSGGLLPYLKFTRTLLAGKHKEQHSSVRSWFIPPRYDLRAIEEAKHQLVNTNLRTATKKVTKPSFTKQAQSLRKDFTQFEKIGVSAIKDIALVLVAGGLGERMKSTAAKVDRKVHYLGHPKIENHSFFAYYLETILALEAHYYQQTGKHTHIPLMVMSAEHNYQNIMAVVKRYTGKGKLLRGQVQVGKQLLAPCVTGTGELAITNGKLMKKPLGHGFVHTLIHQEQYLESLKTQKKSYLFFLQDTNPQVVNTLLSSLGMLKSHRPGFLWITVELHKGEAAGVIVGVRTKKPRPSRQVINVEYNEKPPNLNQSKENALAANTNNFWITTAVYQQALKKTGGVLPYMVNPKKDSNGNITPVRPESLMQDLAKYISLTPPRTLSTKSSFRNGIKTVTALTEKVTTVIYPRYRSYSPVKKPLVFSTTAKPSPIHAIPKSWEYTALELEINHNLTTLISMAGNNTVLWSPTTPSSRSTSKEVCNYLSAFPKIVLPPRYLLSGGYLQSHIKNCTFYPGSFLYIEDDGVILDGITLHSGAALIIHGKSARGFEVRELVVEQRGFSYEPLRKNMEYSEEEKNRGHRLVWKKPLVIDITLKNRKAQR